MKKIKLEKNKEEFFDVLLKGNDHGKRFKENVCVKHTSKCLDALKGALWMTCVREYCPDSIFYKDFLPLDLFSKITKIKRIDNLISCSDQYYLFDPLYDYRIHVHPLLIKILCTNSPDYFQRCRIPIMYAESVRIENTTELERGILTEYEGIDIDFNDHILSRIRKILGTNSTDSFKITRMEEIINEPEKDIVYYNPHTETKWEIPGYCDVKFLK